MASPNPDLVRALRETAARLRVSPDYQWGHMGACNCGFLAQTVTGFGRHRIHAAAMKRNGDWTEQAREYCPTSGLEIDAILDDLFELGLDAHDIAGLERLSDDEVLESFPESERYPRHNEREHVVRYLEVWAALLEEKLASAAARARPAA